MSTCWSCQFLPVGRVVALLESLTGAAPSAAFVHSMLERAGALLAEVDKRVRPLLTLTHVVSADETPLRVGPARSKKSSEAPCGHKWLNVPYDSGVAFCAHPEAHRAAMSVSADYLVRADAGQPREPIDWTPAFSRRARGFAVYAALRSLGKQGVAELVDRTCAHARRFAEGVARLPGCQVLNQVVINQVLFRFQDDRTTDRVLRRVVDSGEAWMSKTTVDGQRAIRLSVSNWQTNERDIDRALEAFRRTAG